MIRSLLLAALALVGTHASAASISTYKAYQTLESKQCQLEARALVDICGTRVENDPDGLTLMVFTFPLEKSKVDCSTVSSLNKLRDQHEDITDVNRDLAKLPAAKKKAIKETCEKASVIAKKKVASFEKMLHPGGEEDDIAGEKLSDEWTFLLEQISAREALAEKAGRGEAFQKTWPTVAGSPQGSEFWLALVLNVDEVGGIDQIIAIMHDYTKSQLKAWDAHKAKYKY